MLILIGLSGCNSGLDPNGLDSPALIPGSTNHYDENVTITHGVEEWFTKYTDPNTNMLRVRGTVHQGKDTVFYISYRPYGGSRVEFYGRVQPGQWTQTFTITGIPRDSYRLYIGVYRID